MSVKRPSLAESMRSVAEAPEPVARSKLATVPAPAPAPEPKELPVRPTGKSGFFAASRVGKVKVTTLLEPGDKKRLNFLALELEKTNESLIAEAISDLFKKYGKTAIGQGKDPV